LQAGDKFDDTVFTLEGEQKKRVFMQLKHKQNTDKQITKQQLLQLGKGGFSLLKYLASYFNIKKNWGKNDLEFCGSFENSECIIYTNAKLAGIDEGSGDCSSGWQGFVNWREIF
jgi:transcriptional antiterminator